MTPDKWIDGIQFLLAILLTVWIVHTVFIRHRP